MKISLIITSQNRTSHLLNLLEGVRKNSLLPSEIVIVSNDAEVSQMDFIDIPIRIIRFDGEEFDIGINRNLGAKNAQYDFLHFLDVDCIPDSNYFETMTNQLDNKQGLLMGKPLYLSKHFQRPFQFSDLQKDAIEHPYRPKVEHLRRAEDYALFWSLCFSLSKQNFEKIGGFDENYKGYGAEDTDFAFVARDRKIDFYLSEAKVYHQQHPIYRPPVNHLEDIVVNSNLFYKKWGIWPMSGWLEEFTQKEWINWSQNQDQPIKIEQLPDAKEVERYRVEEGRFV